MRYNTNKLLTLPNNIKRTLARKLWQSLADNHAFAKENQQIIKELDARWQEIEAEKMKSYSAKEFWNQIEKLKK